MATATIAAGIQPFRTNVSIVDASSISLEDYIRIYGDSPETLSCYYQAQLDTARREMDDMTIMDNAFEIRALCNRIMVLRNRLGKLNARTA